MSVVNLIKGREQKSGNAAETVAAAARAHKEALRSEYANLIHRLARAESVDEAQIVRLLQATNRNVDQIASDVATFKHWENLDRECADYDTRMSQIMSQHAVALEQVTRSQEAERMARARANQLEGQRQGLSYVKIERDKLRREHPELFSGTDTQ